MANPLVDIYGPVLDVGACLVGRNLNLVVVRGFADLVQLAAISAPDVYDPVSNPSGTQRALNKKHAAECFTYALGAGSLVPADHPRSFPEIILNARDRQVVEFYDVNDPETQFELSSFDGDAVEHGSLVGLRVRVDLLDFPHPTKSPQVSRVDGNHRLSGISIDSLFDETDEGEDEIAVPFCLYVGLTTEQEVSLFRDINGEHKGMDVTHLANVAVRLRGDDLKDDKDQRHLWLADELAQSKRAFEGIIFRGGARAGARAAFGAVPPVKLNTLASAIKQQLSKATLTMSNFGDKPDHLLEMLDRYWMAVRSTFPAEWADYRGFILLQTIGLNGFAQLGAALMDQAIGDGDVTQAYFENYLRVVRDTVDLSRQADQWQGIAGAGGAARVAEVLLQAATRDMARRAAIENDLVPADPDPGAVLD